MKRRSRFVTFLVALLTSVAAHAAPITRIVIDGAFGDWAAVPASFDAGGGAFHAGTNIPDVHDTDGYDPDAGEVPGRTAHADVDILEYKFAHDEDSLYAYIRSAGIIGRTQRRTPGSNLASGRYYVIVTIDVDDDDATGYWLHEGGYAPTSTGYDMNMELEFFDGALNTGHYLSHDALTDPGLDQDFRNLTGGAWTQSNDGPYAPGFVQPAAGNYENYTQWVYHENDTLTIVRDRGPVVPGIMSMALSPDGHEIEFRAPFKGFLNNASGAPNMALGKTIDVSISLEASGELALGRNWASDTGDPIVGYYLGVPEPAACAMLVCGLASLPLARRCGEFYKRRRG